MWGEIYNRLNIKRSNVRQDTYEKMEWGQSINIRMKLIDALDPRIIGPRTLIEDVCKSRIIKIVRKMKRRKR